MVETFQYTDAVDGSQILRPLVVTTLILRTTIPLDIFLSLTDIDMSLIFFVGRFWLLGGCCRVGENSARSAFLPTQRPNIVRTASD